MVRCKNRIPYWIDWRLTGLAEPDYGATISFGLPIEPEDSQYGKYRLIKKAYVKWLIALPTGRRRALTLNDTGGGHRLRWPPPACPCVRAFLLPKFRR